MRQSFGGHRLRLRISSPARRRPTAVFLHHGLGAIESWKSLPARLRTVAGVRTLAYERWGYGASDARAVFDAGFMEAEVPVLLEILDEHVEGPAHLVGHSDGATIALLAAAAHPQRVRSVVSIAAHSFVEPITTRSIAELRDKVEREGPPGWLLRFHGERGPALLRAWAQVWLSPAHARWDVRHLLAEVRCPVLAIQGDGDEFGSREQLEVLGREVEGGETWLIEGVGHTPFVDEESFARRIAAFWAAG